MKINPFEGVIFSTRAWLQFLIFLIFLLFDILLLFSAYKYIKLYFFYTKALKNIALKESGYAREKLEKVIGGSFPYADLLAASLELENNNPNNALDILNKIKPGYDDNRIYGFSEILKAIAYTLIYKQSRAQDILSQIDSHLNNALKACPGCLEVNVVSAYIALLHNKSIDAYRKLNEIISSSTTTVEKNALYETVKYLGEIDLLTYKKCESAIDKFQKAILYNPDDSLSLMKYIYCYIKTYKLKGEKDELENLKNSLIYRKISPIQMSLSAEEKYYYSMIFFELGNLYKNAGSIEKAYEAYREGLRHYFCNFDIIAAYGELLQEELAKPDIKPIDKEIKEKELKNLEENLVSRSATPFEVSESLNCIAIKYYKIKNDINKAVELLEKAKNKSPGNSKILANLGILYLKMGRMDAVKEIVESATKSGIHSPLLDKIKGLIK